MKISICITTFNEEKNIGCLLDSLANQTKKPSEVLFIDSESADLTVDIIKNYRSRIKNLKIIVKKCSRAEGRNISIRESKNEIIAMTDAGCVLDSRWLDKIIKPFRNNEVDIVAGFYKMVVKSPFQKALSVFLGVSEFDENFLPSTRSIAFRRRIWRRVGGFPENLEDTAEDTIFDYKAIRKQAKIVHVKNAVVYWSIPDDLKTAVKKVYLYAKGDAKSKVFWHPTKKFRSHNIKVLLVFIRYLVGFAFIFLSLTNPTLLIPIAFFLISYIFWAFYKLYRRFGDFRVGAWGVVLQFLIDLFVMAGFVRGIIS